MSDEVMLARHAESLFWAGRYVERAQDTARLLDVTFHSQTESTAAEARQAWIELLDVMFVLEIFRAGHDTIDADGVNRYLVLDRDNPGSIASSVRRARENARSVRELLSNDLWAAINDFHLGFEGRDVVAELEQHPGQLYDYVKQSCQLVMGAAGETMMRADGWRFFRLGVDLERAEMTCRLLEVYVGRDTSADPLDRPNLIRLLESASATVAFMREGSATSNSAEVVGFLLSNREFPRSVLYCLDRAARSLGSLTAWRGGSADEAQRLLGRLRADLEFLDPADLAPDTVSGFLDRIQAQAVGVADAVSTEFFTGTEAAAVHAQEWRGGPNIGIDELADMPGHRG